MFDFLDLNSITLEKSHRKEAHGYLSMFFFEYFYVKDMHFGKVGIFKSLFDFMDLKTMVQIIHTNK